MLPADLLVVLAGYVPCEVARLIRARKEWYTYWRANPHLWTPALLPLLQRDVHRYLATTRAFQFPGLPVTVLEDVACMARCGEDLLVLRNDVDVILWRNGCNTGTYVTTCRARCLALSKLYMVVGTEAEVFIYHRTTHALAIRERGLNVVSMAFLTDSDLVLLSQDGTARMNLVTKKVDILAPEIYCARQVDCRKGRVLVSTPSILWERLPAQKILWHMLLSRVFVSDTMVGDSDGTKIRAIEGTAPILAPAVCRLLSQAVSTCWGPKDVYALTAATKKNPSALIHISFA